MTTVEVRYHKYFDHRGRAVWVRATRAPGGPWRERWTARQLMAADLSRDEDTQERRSVVYRTASEPLGGPKSRSGSPKAPRATKNNSNR